MFRSLCIVILLAGSASAQTTQAMVEGRVEALLAGIEHVPTPADWEAAGPTEMVARALLDVAQRADARVSTRARALVGMRYAPTEGVRAYLESVASDAAALPTLRGKAALSLGKVAQGAALPVLTRLLESDDPALREDALRGVAEVRTREAINVLVAHEGREAVPHVRELARTLADALRPTVP
ncbi:MAG: hypothetical protein AMXMBFR64_61520 [Myxococcales bacterium]